MISGPRPRFIGERSLISSFVMSHFHDENDLKLLKEMKAAAPEEFKAWAALDGMVGREDGKIPRKYRELIAIASLTQRNASIASKFIPKMPRRSARAKRKLLKLFSLLPHYDPVAQRPTERLR